MHSDLHQETHKNTLKNRVFDATSENVLDCYQCGKCTAGCPLNDEMDIAPNQILRMLQLSNFNLEDKVLSSYSIWLCLSCETCYTRCPKDVDLPAIMDFLRAESIRKDLVNPKAKNIINFHNTFLNSVKSSGRLFEFGLVMGYKMKSFNMFQDAELAPQMISRGKLKFFPHKIHNLDAVRKIFEKTENFEGGK